VKPTKLRVIGGDMRGRIIHYHGEEFTRPMKDNIRENLFNNPRPCSQRRDLL